MGNQTTPDSRDTPRDAGALQGEGNSLRSMTSDAGLGRAATPPGQVGDVDRKVISTLNELIETSKDGEKGFALAAKDTKEPALMLLFSEGEQSCRAAVAELQDLVRKLGGNPEEDGSMKAAVHRGWLSLKSAATSRDSKAILEECERGEDYAKAKYAEAMKLELPEAAREVVARQYKGVIANHDRVRDLRDLHRG